MILAKDHLRTDMKRKILISINSKHVENIISGIKKYEYRRIVAKQDISSIVIYETAPTKRVVAEVVILDVLKLPKEQLWEETKDKAGISKDFFLDYFKGKEIAYAYKLGKIRVFEQPKTLEEYGVRFAPQSFVYLKNP